MMSNYMKAAPFGRHLEPTKDVLGHHVHLLKQQDRPPVLPSKACFGAKRKAHFSDTYNQKFIVNIDKILRV